MSDDPTKIMQQSQQQQQQQEFYQRDDGVEDVLECGTSLAELEFACHTYRGDQKDEKKNHDKEGAMENGQLTGTSSGKECTVGSGVVDTSNLVMNDVDRTTPTAATLSSSSSCAEDIESLRSMIASDVLSEATAAVSADTSTTYFTSPFEDPYLPPGSGKRTIRLPLIYCDQTASNRPSRSIETYLQNACLPFYANTHTNTSVTGSQSTAFVAEARQIVAEETNAKITGKASLDVVLFTGHGTTSSIQLLIDCLGLQHACKDALSSLSNHDGVSSNNNRQKNTRPVVFIGPYEHHSNLIPWRESGCEIVMIPENPHTQQIDYDQLEWHLQRPEYGGRLKMGTFTAASNVTGKVADTNRISSLLHTHGALAFFDYATAAPYMPIDMNPTPNAEYPDASLIAKDAVFLSPHKMLGGVGTTGVLIVKKRLVSQSNPPQRSGGGTVFYVTSTHHRFLSNRIERYEGGTPNISGIMRVGLTFLLKRKAEERYKKTICSMVNRKDNHNNKIIGDDSTPTSMLEYEYSTHDKVAKYLRQYAPNLVLLGSTESDDDNKGPSSNRNRNLPIFSFLIRHGKRFLHYNYVCAILNDVFGIQSRGGCQCAGPYSQRLLGLVEQQKDDSTMTEGIMEVPSKANADIEEALLKYKERAELLRPGYTRISLPFKGLYTEDVEYVMKALVWVSKHGWALMPQYRCNHRTGEWRHWNRQGRPLGKSERRWLGHYDFTSTPMSTASQQQPPPSNTTYRHKVLDVAMHTADAILRSAMSDQRQIAQALKMSDADVVLGRGGTGGGKEDDKLESLRWYVYPKECAMDLASKGDKSNADNASTASFDNNEMLGVLKPNLVMSIMKCSSPDGSKVEVDSLKACSAPACCIKSMDASPETTLAENNVESSDTKPRFAESQVLYFRDGEHTGEAKFREICEGLEDGELSEQCQIYDPDSGVWILTKSLLPSEKQESATNTTKEVAVPINKKQPRDSSRWGTGQAVVPPATNESVAKSSDEKSNGKTGSAQPTKQSKKNSRINHVKPPPKLMRMCTQAMIQWDMLEEGDRLLLGLSGGKDSLSLLHCLMEFQRKLPIKFDIEVCTIDPMTPSFDPSPLIPYVESLGLKYHYIRDDIVSRASTAGKNGKMVSSLCSFCARMKRGILYACARKNKCNKLVLAQHLDDCAESFLMSVMHNGFLRTMKANYKINAGDISVIRPLVYCRESLMTDFAKSANLPVINENCPACFEEPKERARMKKLLSREETLYPNFYDNIKRSLLPLMHDDSTAILRSYMEQTLAKSRKENQTKKRKRQVDGDGDGEKKLNDHDHCTDNGPPLKGSLETFTDVDLMLELARRKAEKYRLSGAMKRVDDADDPDGNQPMDLTGQVCSLTGGNGTIPCYELME